MATVSEILFTALASVTSCSTLNIWVPSVIGNIDNTIYTQDVSALGFIGDGFIGADFDITFTSVTLDLASPTHTADIVCGSFFSFHILRLGTCLLINPIQ